MNAPSPHVLDLFAVPEPVRAIPGGQGQSVLAGDLVLSPGRDGEVAGWLNPMLARLAVRLREREPGAGFRIAIPVPARDGNWVVEGWAATTYEPGTRTCLDLPVTLAAGRALHARLAVGVPEAPETLGQRNDRWQLAARMAFGELALPVPEDLALSELLASLERIRVLDADLGPSQLVHADLAGNVLLDGEGTPVIIDFSPAWRPARWAEAVCVLDSVMWFDAPAQAMTQWTHGLEKQLMVRAAIFRLLSDREPDTGRYRQALDVILPE